MPQHIRHSPEGRRRRVAARLLAASLLVPLGACASDGWLSSGFSPATAAGDVDAASLMRVADATRASGDLASAAGMYNRAHQLAPDDVAPLLALGETLRRMGASATAADAYRAALDIAPRNFDALRGLGAALLEVDQPEFAIAQLELALDVAKDHRVYNALGVAHDMLGDHAAAQVYYREGLDLMPGNAQIANNLGLSLALAGDYAEGIAMLEQAVQDRAATPRFRQNLALAYGLAGQKEAAERVAAIDLDQAAVAHNMSYYDLLRRADDSSMTASALGTHPADSGS